MAKKTQPPKHDYLAENARKARELGLSYGEYMGFVESGYIDTYIDHWLSQTAEDGNIIESSIGMGGKGSRKTGFTGTRRS